MIDRVKTKIAQIAPGLPTKTLPDGTVSRVRIVSFYDRTTLIHETIATLSEALIQEAIAAALVVFFFLFHLRSSLAIVGTLPLSVGISFIVMYLLGVDSNIMSLAGLAIAIGDVADMGLIMTENIYRHVAQNDGSKSYYQCVEDGAIEAGHRDRHRRLEHHRLLPAGLCVDRPRAQALCAAGLHEDVRDCRLRDPRDHRRAGPVVLHA